tara:strand:- start:673 stop:1119 length:447 start_codon:yes stop_codon:yes gene_type:complete
MVTTSSGAISIGNLRTEFDISGTSGSRALSAFYDASARPYDDAVHSNTNIPSSGAVALSDFYATENTYYRFSAPIFYWSKHSDDSGKDAYAVVTIIWNGTTIVSGLFDQYHSRTSYSAGGQTYLLHTSKGGYAHGNTPAQGIKYSVER